ncbi:MAG TPA: polysaccharide biosynthesis C-terminal domain-containing protein [Bacteroidales bacterium]
MNHLKNLAGQTVIYGLSTIVSRFLNYLLTPFYTYIFVPSAFADVTVLYAYVTFLNIILTYGMETGLFFFAKQENRSLVYGTAFISILATTSLFVIFSLYFLKDIASLIGYQHHARYVFWFVLILGFDSLAAIPFANLRQQNKAFRFALLKLLNVLITIFINVILIWVIPHFFVKDHQLFGFKYHVSVELIFIANCLGSLITFLILIPDLIKEKLKFNMGLWKRMVNYSYPLLFAGLIGTINETLDRILLQNYLPKNVDFMAQIGIYGACVRVAMLMAIFTQMFRFAAEPYIFNRQKSEDQKTILADSTKYFFLFGMVIFLGVISYLGLIQYFIGPKYREGLKIVSVYMLGSLGLGVYFNLSFWYKLNGKTYFGILITAFGALLTILINIFFIPQYGYVASAWARLICYVTIVLISYFLGQHYYPIKYPIANMMKYLILGLILFWMATHFNSHHLVLNLVKNSIIFGGFIYYLERKEKLLSLFIKK